MENTITNEMLSKARRDALFTQEAIFVGGADVIPTSTVERLFDKQAVEYVMRCGKDGVDCKSYRINGSCKLNYLTYSGFKLAVTYHNVMIANGG